MIICVHSDEMSEQLLDVGPKYVFTMASITEKVEKAIKHCDKVKVIFCICGIYYILP